MSDDKAINHCFREGYNLSLIVNAAMSILDDLSQGKSSTMVGGVRISMNKEQMLDEATKRIDEAVAIVSGPPKAFGGPSGCVATGSIEKYREFAEEAKRAISMREVNRAIDIIDRFETYTMTGREAYEQEKPMNLRLSPGRFKKGEWVWTCIWCGREGETEWMTEHFKTAHADKGGKQSQVREGWLKIAIQNGYRRREFVNVRDV